MMVMVAVVVAMMVVMLIRMIMGMKMMVVDSDDHDNNGDDDGGEDGDDGDGDASDGGLMAVISGYSHRSCLPQRLEHRLLLPPTVSAPVPARHPSRPLLPLCPSCYRTPHLCAPVRPGTSFQVPLLFASSFPIPGPAIHSIFHVCVHVRMSVLCGSTLVFAIVIWETAAPGKALLTPGMLWPSHKEVRVENQSGSAPGSRNI